MKTGKKRVAKTQYDCESSKKLKQEQRDNVNSFFKSIEWSFDSLDSKFEAKKVDSEHGITPSVKKDLVKALAVCKDKLKEGSKVMNKLKGIKLDSRGQNKLQNLKEGLIKCTSQEKNLSMLIEFDTLPDNSEITMSKVKALLKDVATSLEEMNDNCLVCDDLCKREKLSD
eukprot:12756594-Alexandrium_andersonii.AAC.1